MKSLIDSFIDSGYICITVRLKIRQRRPWALPKEGDLMKKGIPKSVYTYSDRDIAKVAGVSIGAMRVAKARRKITPKDLRSVTFYIMEHWLKSMQKKGKV
jgi:hypothetical protein